MSIQAQWVGGPWDGRSDELPDGCYSIKVAVSRARMDAGLANAETVSYVELELQVCEIFPGEYVIVWHEPR